ISPLRLRPDLPEPAAAAILKALAKRPQDRFASAGALSWAFTAGLQGQWAEGLRPPILGGAIGRGTTTVQQFAPPPTAQVSSLHGRIPPGRREGIPRRTVALGLLGLAALGAGALWLAQAGYLPPPFEVISPPPTPPVRTVEPTNTPENALGSTLSIYRGHAD